MSARLVVTLLLLCLQSGANPHVAMSSGDTANMEAHVPDTSIRITRQPLVPSGISPMQHGQFIEYLCDLVPGMWADKLDDGSFEGLTPYAFAFIKETDDRSRPWFPSGAVNRADFARDADSRVDGQLSQRIAVGDGPPCTVGISQHGISLKRGLGCRLSVHLKGSALSGSVKARLHAGRRELAACSLPLSDDWRRVEAHLVPSGTEPAATLTLEFRGPGTVWLDCASLMPDDAVGGWRADVARAIRELRPGIIRFGGSVVDYPSYGDYEWRKTIGPVHERTPFRSWGGAQPTGAGLEEIVQLIQSVGAEPLLCVRFYGSTPDEAAAQVEYFNGPPTSPMGSLRARNGHAKPYGIRYWQIGNEVKSPDYDAGIAAFCRAMRRADASIKLLASYPTAEVLRNAGTLLDYVCPHHYGCADLAYVEANTRDVRALIADSAPGSGIKVGVTEWNTTAGDWGTTRAGLWTLANALACARYHNLMHRHADVIEIANRSNLTNSFCSGIIQTDASRLYKTPTYYAQQLYAQRGGTVPLAVETQPDSPGDLDISATGSRDGRRITVFAVNDTPNPVSKTLDARATGIRNGAVRVTCLTDRDGAGEPDVTNTFDRPERVRPVTTTCKASGGLIRHTFPRWSLTVLEWRAALGRQAP